VRPDERAQEALRLMVDEAIEHLPVIHDHRVIGICTRTDLLKVRRRQYELERPQDGLAARARSHEGVRWLRGPLRSGRRVEQPAGDRLG